MKNEIMEALAGINRAYGELNRNPDVLAPQFVAETKARLAIIIMDMSKIIDACVESEQINGGLN